jgi:hypothetical protein
MKIKTLYTYCEQVGRRGKDYEKKRNETKLYSGQNTVILRVGVFAC